MAATGPSVKSRQICSCLHTTYVGVQYSIVPFTYHRNKLAREARRAIAAASRQLEISAHQFGVFSERALEIPSLSPRGGDRHWFKKEAEVEGTATEIKLEFARLDPEQPRRIELKTPGRTYFFNKWGAVTLKFATGEFDPEIYTPDRAARFVSASDIHVDIPDRVGRVRRAAGNVEIAAPWAYFPVAGQEAIEAHFDETIQQLMHQSG